MSQLFTNFTCEHFKAKRRLLPLIFLGTLVFYAAYFLRVYSDPHYRADSIWATVFYDLTIWNSLLLPIAIAAYASRLFDTEHRGNTLKLLETLDGRGSIFAAKLLYGALYILLFVLLQMLILLPFCGHYINDTPLPPLKYLLWYFGDTLLVSFILFLFASELALVFVNQAVCILSGIAGTMIGFLSLLLPNRTLYLFIPWCLYAATGFASLHWEHGDPQNLYYAYDGAIPHAQGVSVLWLLLALALGLYLLRHYEESALFSIRKNDTHVINHESSGSERLSHFPAELLKLRHSPVWIAFFVLPVLSSFFGTINYLGNLEILTNGWYSLWSQHTLFLGLFFFPALIALFASYLWSLENKGTNWIPLRSCKDPAAIFLSKAGVCVLFSTLGILWIMALFLLIGKLCGIGGAVPAETLDWLICGIIGACTLCLFQLLLSLILRSFILPIVICVFVTMLVFYIAAGTKRLVYALPHTLMLVGLRANNPEWELRHGLFFLSCALWSVLCVAAGILYLKRSDVKTR